MTIPLNQTQMLRLLLPWYEKHGRHDMPWRITQDSYAIVVSEFMLQQTTVGAVLPYYRRFLERFPSLDSLAKAPLSDVLALWSGLGYYARARNLWAAMKTVRKNFDGRIPSDQFELQKLPGIGLYTSGAIASLAFNQPAMVLDGNIVRVLMRLLAMEEDPRLKAVQVILRKLSLDLTGAGLSSVRPKSKGGAMSATKIKKTKRSAGWASGSRHVVLALMDLGATVCLPQNPLCSDCPLQTLCLARVHGNQDQIPAKGDETERLRVRRLYAVIEKKRRWLMAQRPPKGLFGGLWEFIGVDVSRGEDPIQLIEGAVLKEAGLKVRVEEALKGFDHQLSHRDFHIQPYRCQPLGIPNKTPHKNGVFYEKILWIPNKELHSIGLSSLTNKILKLRIL